MLRLFTALPAPYDVVEILKGLQSGVPGARWRPEEALHVTLSFYGEVSERQAEDLTTELGRIRMPGGATSAAGGAMQIAIKGVGAFGDAHRSHTLWAGIEADERLGVLAARCRTAGERAGIRMEPRTYRPHLTLAYLNAEADGGRTGAWIAEHNLLTSAAWPVGRFGLYSSTLRAGGSEYALEQDYPL